MMSHTIKEIAIYAADLYKQRTIDVVQDKADVYSISAYTRVGWNELCSLFPELRNDIVNNRIDFQPLFEKEIRKRGLWKVFQGKETSSQWYERTQSI